MTSDAYLDELYFHWLYSLVGSVKSKNPGRTYWSLCDRLHRTTFTWFVPNDDNRIEDGKELRLEFLDGVYDQELNMSWMDLECSILEMMIALSRRASFETGEAPDTWFWIMLENLNLRTYSDKVYARSMDKNVSDILDTVNQRSYGSDGKGGLFPLRYSKHDQRKTELWYQWAAYVLEHDTSLETLE